MANTYTKLNIHIVFHVKSTGITIRQKDLGQVFAYIGGIKQEENGKLKYNGYGYPAKTVQPGYPDSWKKALIDETGDLHKKL